MIKGKKLATVWVKLFPLGLTKQTVKYHLSLNNWQLQHVWTRPAAVLTLPQVHRLCGLVAPHYPLPELAKLLVADEYRPASELNTALQEAIKILMTDEGQAHWDEFMARKRAGNQGIVKKRAKKEKIRVSRQVFPRISDELATDENLTEFNLEHKRLAELKESQERLKGSDTSSSDGSGPIVSI